MLTVDFERLGLRPRERVLDLGCGDGRHAFEAYRGGAEVVAMDLDAAGLATTRRTLGALAGGATPASSMAGPPACPPAVVRGDARRLPCPDGAFDAVICAETLEHIQEDDLAMSELARVLRPGGRLVVSVPRRFPERICWALSREYHEVPGGHVRIYRASELARRIEAAGFRAIGRHHAHALHSPYWWLRCLLGPPERARLTRWWQAMLVWDIERSAVRGGTPVGWIERRLDPLLGKSVVLYFERTQPARVAAAAPSKETEHAGPALAGAGR